MVKQAKEKPRQPAAHHNRQQELQEKYIELQMLKQQVSTFVEQKQAIDEREHELNVTLDALRKLGSIKTGEEMWSSIGSGAFVRSDIKDIDKVLVAIGAGVVIKEHVPKAVEIIESRLNDINTVSQEIVKQANAMVDKINKLEPEVQRLAEEQR